MTILESGLRFLGHPVLYFYNYIDDKHSMS